MVTTRNSQTLAGANAADDDVGNLGQVFLNGVPAMTGIVTVITQPFAQDSMRAMFGLPEWIPIIVALIVSGLLAVHRMWIVRRYPAKSCAICVPLLMLIIFSAYVTGNNVVYYAKEGLNRPEAPKGPSRDELTILARERDLLRQQLESAQEVITTFRRALNLPEPPKPQSLVPYRLGRVLTFIVGEAHAQSTRPPRPRKPTPQELQEALRKYEEEQRELKRKLEKTEEEREKIQESPKQQQPLIKSW